VGKEKQDKDNHIKLKTENSSSTKDNDETSKESSEDLKEQTESQDALLHLRLLKELFMKDLSRTLKVRQEVDAGTARRTTFIDLWHVFRYGQEVRGPGTKEVQM
jgi:hypothetical protein